MLVVPLPCHGGSRGRVGFPGGRAAVGVFEVAAKTDLVDMAVAIEELTVEEPEGALGRGKDVETLGRAGEDLDVVVETTLVLGVDGHLTSPTGDRDFVGRRIRHADGDRQTVGRAGGQQEEFAALVARFHQGCHRITNRVLGSPYEPRVVDGHHGTP